jgi:EAL domain-containing protein (putative c-di-GMP-specific phosphodiesterase class I)
LAQVLTETNFPPQRLEVEVTESALFEDLPLAISTVESLKALGITVSLDDFGTGYSSLSQLKALPFDRIKIDRSFVISMLEDDESAAIVGAIASLAKSLKLPITAEGIETDAVRAALRALGCSEGQGWHYGRPLAHDQICEQYPDVVLGRRVVQHGVTPLALRAVEREAAALERRDNRRRGSRAA